MAKTILVVDDDENILNLEKTILEQKGFAVTMAAGGPEALALLEKETFDLILLDVMMPEIDGFEVCRRIKEDERLKEIPVIFLTAKGGGDALAEGFESGAVMYINKPFTANKLLTIVNTMLEGAPTCPSPGPSGRRRPTRSSAGSGRRREAPRVRWT